MGNSNRVKYHRIKELYRKFYDTTEKSGTLIKLVRYFSILFFPYLALFALYLILRWEEAKAVNLLFQVVVLISSIFFLYAPILLHRFIIEFKKLQTDTKLPPETRSYFIEQSERHFTIFIRYKIIESILFIIIAVVPIIIFPEILCKNITRGYGDWFFWLLIIFLMWFVSYCVNATAFVSLLFFHIIPDMRKDKLLNYSPIIESHRYAIKKIRKLCGSIIKYISSAIILIPLALYYLYQQPDIIKKGNALRISTPSSQHPIYTIWVVTMLLFYAFFLFFFLTYQNVQIQDYIKKKNAEYLLRSQIKYINRTRKGNISTRKRTLSSVIYEYNEYLNLQEIRLLCKTSVSFDVNTVLTYITIVLSILSAIQGIQKIIEWTPPS